MSKTTSTKRKLTLPIVIAGGLSSLVLAVGMTPTFSAFTASIQNTVNTAGTGTLALQEIDAAGNVTCNSTDGGSINTNAATCATINKYGGNLAMNVGDRNIENITLKNTGTVDAAAFTLTPGACTQSANGSVNGSAVDLCAKTTVTIVSGSNTIYSGTAAAFGSAGTINLLSKINANDFAANTSIPVTITVKLDGSLGNTYQGLKISQPMTWAVSA